MIDDIVEKIEVTLNDLLHYNVRRMNRWNQRKEQEENEGASNS